MSRLSVRAVLAAMRKNGYEKNYGDYITRKGNKLFACALGQAALNIDPANPAPAFLDSRLSKLFHKPGVGEDLSTFIVHKNDDTEMTVPEIADAAEQWLINNGFDLETPVFI
jgi:hypothetical protein